MKTIYISKLISDQISLGESVKKINGNVPYKEREQILNDFNSNIISEIVVSYNLVITGGVRYVKNGHDIKIKFTGDFTEEDKEKLNKRIQYNIR